MSLIDDIRKDREIGTKGPYGPTTDHEWSLDTDGENSYFVIAGKGIPFALVAVETAFGDDDRNEADMRRVCRLDKMEAALLAADFLIDRLEEFDLTDDADEMSRAFIGHVEPALKRLSNALKVGDA